MKKKILFLLCLFSATLCIAQTEVEKFLIREGFESVRHISDNGREIFYLGSRAFATDQRLISSIRKSVDSLSSRLENDRIDVILLRNKLPVFHMQSSKILKDKNDKLLWRSDFHLDENCKVLRNIGARKRFYNPSPGKIDLLFYPQFRFKNSRLDKMYLLQVNLNPTLEMDLWKGAKLTAQIIVPLYNDYSEEESEVRPGFLTISQDLRLPGNIFTRVTVGNFNMFRAGADLKLFKPVGERVGFYGQIGVTAMSIMLFDKWYYTDLNKTTWKAGANYFVKPWNLMFDLSVGKYLGNDFAARGEIMRYFKNSTVGFYIQTIEKEDFPINGGFFFSIALPPYTHKRRGFIRISPARYFHMEYIARPYPDVGRTYNTAPDESSSENFFNVIRLKQIIDNTN